MRSGALETDKRLIPQPSLAARKKIIGLLGVFPPTALIRIEAIQDAAVFH